MVVLKDYFEVKIIIEMLNFFLCGIFCFYLFYFCYFDFYIGGVLDVDDVWVVGYFFVFIFDYYFVFFCLMGYKLYVMVFIVFFCYCGWDIGFVRVYNGSF